MRHCRHISSNRLLIKKNARDVLDQKISILEAIDQDQYVYKDKEFFGASIGAHIRHSLDHFGCAMASTVSKEYDVSRSRGGSVEISKKAALKETLNLRRAIDDVDVSNESLWNQPLKAVFLADPQTGKFFTAESTFAREIAFAAHHATHHHAMISLMISARGIDKAQHLDVGIANSTQMFMGKAGEKQPS
jgi:hypothetical protein